MDNHKHTRRGLKREVHDLLERKDFDKAMDELSNLPVKRAINSLFPFLYDKNDQTKWRAITAMGTLVSELADRDMESARVIIRRLMWNLNDESGGIGWGSAEAMGEILASHRALAREYHRILISYAREDGNFQEHPLMQRGVLWGIARLSQVRPELIIGSTPHILPFLASKDPYLRGVSSWIAGLVQAKEARPYIEKLTGDHDEVRIYVDRDFITKQVKDLAEEALERLVT